MKILCIYIYILYVYIYILYMYMHKECYQTDSISGGTFSKRDCPGLPPRGSEKKNKNPPRPKTGPNRWSGDLVIRMIPGRKQKQSKTHWTSTSSRKLIYPTWGKRKIIFKYANHQGDMFNFLQSTPFWGVCMKKNHPQFSPSALRHFFQRSQPCNWGSCRNMSTAAVPCSKSAPGRIQKTNSPQACLWRNQNWRNPCLSCTVYTLRIARDVTNEQTNKEAKT